jgi:hypothetical protein
VSPKTKALSLSIEEQRSRLERRANVIRSRLVHTIDALDSRRHQVQELGHHAKRLVVPALAALLGVAAIAVGTSFAIRALIKQRRERAFGYRMSTALARFRTPTRPPFWKEALRKVTLAALVVVANELAKRGVHVLIARREPLALGPASGG